MGNRLTQSSPAGLTSYVYDENNRLTQAGATTYAYDQDGNLTSISTGQTFTWDALNRMTQATGPGGPVTYTYNGDGLKVRRTAAPAETTLTFGAGGAGWIPLAGDWNGDGTATVGAYDPATATFYLRNSNSSGTADLTFVFGPAAAGWMPLAGDWDGNGTDTVGLYEPATGTFHLRNTNSAGPADLTFAFGAPGLVPITGDWNADRTDTIGVYDGATATVFLRNANSAGAADLTFAYGPAGAGWKPLAGDWNGDAVDTIGLYDPATATFSLRNAHSAGAADLTVTYGPAGAGWTPLAGDWTHAGADPVGVSNPATAAYNLRTATGAGTEDTTLYYYDGIRPIWETDGAGTLLVQSDRDIFGNLLSRRLGNSNARRYAHYDGIGSTTALTTEDGTLAAATLYEAWGSTRSASGGGQGTYRFTGAERDGTTGLYHMGARFYEPAIGRWLSEDPMQSKPFDPATLNYYAYVNGNPVALVDHTGEAAQLAPVATGLIAAGGALIAVPAAPIVAGVVVATALGIAVGVGATVVIDHMAQARAKQTAGFANQAAIHLADFFGRSVGGRNPRPGKDRRNPDEFLKQAKEFVKQALEKAKGNWEKLVEYLERQGWSRSEIDDFLKALEEAGIKPK